MSDLRRAVGARLSALRRLLIVMVLAVLLLVIIVQPHVVLRATWSRC